MIHRNLKKALPLTSLLLLVSAFNISTLPKHSVSAASTTFSISAGPDAIASGDGCSLSEAIANINASNTTHSDCPAGVSTSGDINVISLPADTITLTTDLPIITKPTNIIGQGKGVSVVDGNSLDNAFGITLVGFPDGLNLEYRDFTVKNLVNQHANSGQPNECLTVAISSVSTINVDGVDTIDCAYSSMALGKKFLPNSNEASGLGSNVSISNSNIIQTGVPGVSDFSRGIVVFAAKDVSFNGVTVSGNTFGATNYVRPSTPETNFTVTNSTFTNNVFGVAASVLQTSGSQNDLAFDMKLANNTIYGNYSSQGPGNGLLIESIDNPQSNFTQESNISLQNNIIANNASNNCQTTGSSASTVTITSLGNNLSDNGCLSSFGSSDILSENIDSTISALADNGGAVKTLALKAGSPAIDTAATIDSITTDARGFSRPFGVAYDIGAYEYGATDSNPPPTDPPKPPKTGRLAVAILITTSILAVVLLIARAYQKRYHKVLGSDR